MNTTDTCITVVEDGVTKRDPNVIYVRACDEIDLTTTIATVAVDTPPLPEAGTSMQIATIGLFAVALGIFLTAFRR